MKSLTRIYSKSGSEFIDICKCEDGNYRLRKTVKKYDSEEEVYYQVRDFPDPVGIYADLDSATLEARRVLK